MNIKQLVQHYFIGSRALGLEDKKDKKDYFLFFNETLIALIITNLCWLHSLVLGVRG